MALSMINRAPGTLPSNIETNPKERVMTLSMFGNKIIEDPAVKAITTNSGVQLSKLHIKQPSASNEITPSSEEEEVEQTGQTI